MTPIGDPLDRLAPALAWKADWADVLDRAGERAPRRRRAFTSRRLLVALAVLVAVLVPLAALAAEHDWWFLSLSNTPEPASRPVVVMEGTWSGRPWHVVAYRSRKEGICVGMVADLTRVSDVGLACGPLPLSPGIAAGTGTSTGTDYHAIPDYVLGHVVDTARTVEVRFATMQAVRLPTVAVPAFLGPVRFFAAPLPKSVERPTGRGPWFPIWSLTGYDADGEVVACSVPGLGPGPPQPLSACR